MVLTDEYEEIEGHSITERFISVIEPGISKGAVKIGNVTIKCNDLPVIRSRELINRSYEKEKVYILDYKVTNKKFSAEIIV